MKNLFKNIFDLTGKISVVTGGTGLLGSIYCRALAEFGSNVAVVDIDQNHCEKLAKEITDETGVKAVGFSVDLINEDSVRSLARNIIDSFEGIDILVNNAAAKPPHFFSPLEKFPIEDWDYVMAVNNRGIFLTVREFGPFMVAKGKGSIINISSIYGIVGPDQRIYEGSWYEELGESINTPLVYSTSKGAVIAMTKYLAAHWGPKGVRTNTISPGGVFSGQNNVFKGKYSERVPLGRMARPDEMIGALIFLASDASSYVNGQNIVVDGGWTAW